MAGPAKEAVDLTGIMVTEPVPFGDWLVIAPTVLMILAGSLLVMLRRQPERQAVLANASLVVLVAITAALLFKVISSGPVVMTMGRWLPPFGITFAADIVGAGFAFLTAVCALFVGLYAASDISQEQRRYGFYPLLLLMIGGVCGAFLTGDIFNLYVWFEVLLISSFGLIVLGNTRAQLDGAVRYAVLNLVATTLFLIAVGYLYATVGTLNMADIVVKVRASGTTIPIFAIAALFTMAFGMKAAAFPLNFWLPASYHTPALPVAAIFAGLLTKVGIYALLRIMVMLLPDQRLEFANLLVWVAIGTMLIGSFGALAQSDFRRILGFVVVSGIGVIFAGFALGSPIGVAGSLLYAFHSMLVMTALYLAVGIAGRLVGSFELPKMGGIYSASPLLAGIVLVLVFAVSGLPPFSGFWPKLVLTQAALLDGQWLLAAIVLLTGFLTSIAMGRAFAHSFWRGGPAGTPDGDDETIDADLDRATLLRLAAPSLALTGLVVFFGLWPQLLVDIADIGAASLIDPTLYVESVLGVQP